MYIRYFLSFGGVKLNPKWKIDIMPLFQETTKEIAEISKTIVKLDSALDEIVFSV